MIYASLATAPSFGIVRQLLVWRLEIRLVDHLIVLLLLLSYGLALAPSDMSGCVVPYLSIAVNAECIECTLEFYVTALGTIETDHVSVCGFPVPYILQGHSCCVWSCRCSSLCLKDVYRVLAIVVVIHRVIYLRCIDLLHILWCLWSLCIEVWLERSLVELLVLIEWPWCISLLVWCEILKILKIPLRCLWHCHNLVEVLALRISIVFDSLDCTIRCYRKIREVAADEKARLLLPIEFQTVFFVGLNELRPYSSVIPYDIGSKHVAEGGL